MNLCSKSLSFGLRPVNCFKVLMSKNIKRKNDEETVNSSKKSACGFWANGLLGAMEDPNLRVISDSRVVVIKDKYPKAKYHYLILPKESISSLKSINKSHLEILEHMHHIACNMAQQDEHKNNTFKMGYHAEPSMNHLHMHLISDDFSSDCLKTKRHYNSFTTDHFIDSQKLIESVKRTGKVMTLSREETERLLKQSLVCHKCGEEVANMPKLKKHLNLHAESPLRI